MKHDLHITSIQRRPSSLLVSHDGGQTFEDCGQVTYVHLVTSPEIGEVLIPQSCYLVLEQLAAFLQTLKAGDPAKAHPG